MSGKGLLAVGAPAPTGVGFYPSGGAWWSPPQKLLASAVLAVLLFWSFDVSLLAPPSIHLSPFFLGTFSVSKTAAATTTSITATRGGGSTGIEWIAMPKLRNYTSILISRWLVAGSDASRTADISVRVPALGNDVDYGASSTLRLATAALHELVITAFDESGRPRGLGGDYFETDLSGPFWKSRPPVTDHGNGSYSVDLQVHPGFAGDYNLTVVLLFRSFEGLKFSPERFKFRRELRSIAITFYNEDGEGANLPSLRVCRSSDFSKEAAWSGRWTRHAKVDECGVDDDGRYRCLPRDFPCASPWCEGLLGTLESNGWVYSAHCAFRLFTQEAAWKCLRGKWLFFWGDSNHVDTIRNLLNFVLGLWDVKAVPRRFDTAFVNPSNASETVRITNIFNGHWNETMNYLGLQSLRNDGFRRLLWKYFNKDGPSPDAMFLNSGLHDGVYWRSVRAFAEGADYAAQFWDDVIGRLRRKPRVFYRTTVATGGYARDLAFNPSKMDAFNAIFVEKLMEKGLLLTGGVIDDFDMTFPWHYDNRCNDGVHYGRGPAKVRWRDGQVGHQYFVDLMLVHVLLNGICNE